MKRFFTYFICLLLSIGFVLEPVDARAFGEMSVEDEYKLGQELNLYMKTRAPIIFDPVVQSYLQNITNKLLAYATPQPFVYEANMLVDPVLNAFATPGGFLFMNTGLFLKMENESELAGIMAHEIAHVTQRHIAKREGKATGAFLASALAAALAVALGGEDAVPAALTGSMAASQAAMLNYSRQDETEADNVGFEYMTKAGYDPYGYVTSFQKLQGQFAFSTLTPPVYLSSHPDLNARISGIDARIRSKHSEYKVKDLDNSQFLFVQDFVRAQFETLSTAKVAVLKMNPDLAISQLCLGIVNTRDYKIQEARKNYAKVLELAPNDPFYMREVGRFYYLHGDINEAYNLLNNALRLNRQDTMARFFLARVQSELGLHEDAQNNYNAILKKHPQDAEVHNLLARSYGPNGHKIEGYIHLAYAKLYQADFASAKQMIERARSQASTKEQEAMLEKFDKDYKIYEDLIKK